MASREAESTVVLRMLKDFDSFVSKHEKKNQPSLSANVTRHLTFDESCLLPGSGSSTETNSAITCDIGNLSAFSVPSAGLSPELIKKSDSRKRQTLELISTKSKLSRLESKLSESEVSNELVKIECEKQLQSVKLEQKSNQQKLEELRRQLMHMTAKEAGAQCELKKLKNTFEMTKLKHEKQLSNSQKEWTEIKAELDEQIAQLNEAVYMLERDLHSEQMEKVALRSDLDSYEEQLQQYSQKSIDVSRYMQEAERATEEASVARSRIKELESELAQFEDARKIIKILEGQESKLRELEKENKHLKESNRILSLREDNIMLLTEELENSKRTIEKLDKQTQDLSHYQFENEDLKRELNNWQSLTAVGCDSHTSPQSLARAITELQRQKELLLEQVGRHNSNNNSLERIKRSLEEELNKVKLELQSSQSSFKQSNDQIRHLQRKLLLVSKERDACRDILDSYSKDLTFAPPIQEGERTRNMEIIDSYRHTVEILETELDSAREQLRKSGFQSGVEVIQERDAMKSEINSLRSQVSACESNILQLQEEKKLLEMRIEYYTIRGEINPLKTRVIHLASNPVSWARQQRAAELELVKKENEVLKQRVKVLEESGPLAEDITFQVEQKLKVAPPTKVLESLQAQLLAAEAKNKRLIEGFKKISNEFREVTYVLLGYNIELPCSNQYKLSNMYAESPDDYLLFSKNENDELQLLETPYSLAIADNIDLFLHRNHSIPAFLSNITLELFKSQTGIFSTMLDSNLTTATDK